MSLRTLLRVPPICIVTLLAHGTILLSRLLRPFAPGFQLRIRNQAFGFWGRTLCRVMGMRLEVSGCPPEGRFFLVTNHVGYVDIMLLASQVPAAFVAKADLRGWPFLGSIFLAADTIFVDRRRKRDLLRVMQRVQSGLDRGLGVVLFAEGTSGKGEEVLPLKSSLLQLPVECGYPVHYATLSYRSKGQAPPHQTICWWDDTPFVTHFLRLLDLPYFEATLRFGTGPIRGDDRKQLADQLRTAMARDFVPIT